MDFKMETLNLNHVIISPPHLPDTPPDSPADSYLEGIKHPSIPAEPLDEMGVIATLGALKRKLKLSRSSADNENGNLDGGLDGGIERANHSLDIARRVSYTPSAAPTLGSFRYHGASGVNWNEGSMAGFTDQMRRALRDSKLALDQTMNMRWPNSVLESDLLPDFRSSVNTQNELAILLPDFAHVISVMMAEEPLTQQAVTYEFVVNTYWERLLADISKNKDVISDREIVRQAAALEKMWAERFGMVKWHTILRKRKEELKKNGCLRGLILKLRPDWEVGEPLDWIVQDLKSGANAEGSLGFTPGFWWVNTHAAMRDGIIADAKEATTRGASGVTALALMTGEEKDTPYPNTSEYIIEGYKKAMPFSLLGQRHPVRILRGMELKSRYAPEVGVRYDGLYMIKSYSHKLADDQTNLYCCKLMLERIEKGQKALAEVLLQPKPSQLDQYDLYREDIGPRILDARGQEIKAKWSAFCEEEKRERDKWRREFGLPVHEKF